jgi:ferredoxin
MSENNEALFEAFLKEHDDTAWRHIITALLPKIHAVDRAATQIWFHFFPLALLRLLQNAENPEQMARMLSLQGNYYLKDQIDTSHRFFYGHRFWPRLKPSLVEYVRGAGPGSLCLEDHICRVAQAVSAEIGVDRSLLVGITAVAFMTIEQVGIRAFAQSPGKVSVGAEFAAKTPEQIIKSRIRDDPQWIFGFLRGDAKRYTVVFDENDQKARFRLINTQHITTAAASDKRPHHLRDPRCTPNEGPIPVQCRSAACGTCWVGVLAGAEKLSEVAPLERRRIREFGYIDTDEPRPLIRLACQAQAFGNVTIVIPPWNGVFGKYIRTEKPVYDFARTNNQ